MKRRWLAGIAVGLLSTALATGLAPASAGAVAQAEGTAQAAAIAQVQAAVTIEREELVTVTSDSFVVTWKSSVPGDTTVFVGPSPDALEPRTLTGTGTYHYGEVTGLAPDRVYYYQVSTGGARGPLSSVRTLRRPPGRYLFSFALVTDTHVATGGSAGDLNEIYLGKMTEHSAELLTEAIDSLTRRGAEFFVANGDLTDSGTETQVSTLAGVLGGSRVPYYLGVGNHDKYSTRWLEHHRALSGQDRSYYSFDHGGVHFAVLDSAREGSDWGHLTPEQLAWLEEDLRAHPGQATFLFLHHPVNGLDLWFGVDNWLQFQRLLARFPQVVAVVSGHMHRNELTHDWLVTWDLPYAEVAATVQYPMGFAVFRVYSGGFEQSFYKIPRLELSEASRDKVLFGLGTSLYTWYALGSVGDRNYSYAFDPGVQAVAAAAGTDLTGPALVRAASAAAVTAPAPAPSTVRARLYRPESYVVSRVLPEAAARHLYQQVQAGRGKGGLAGASLNPAGNGQYEVVLGRFAARTEAEKTRQAVLGARAAFQPAVQSLFEKFEVRTDEPPGDAVKQAPPQRRPAGARKG